MNQLKNECNKAFCLERRSFTWAVHINLLNQLHFHTLSTELATTTTIPPQRCRYPEKREPVLWANADARYSWETSANTRTASPRQTLGLSNKPGFFLTLLFCNATPFPVTAILLLLPLTLCLYPPPPFPAKHSTALPHSLIMSVSIFLWLP